MIRKKKPSLRKMFGGKVRRFLMAHQREGRAYIRRMLRRRRGHCARCGVCCMLVHRCPFLRIERGLATCLIHALRPANCRIFPVDPQDLEERDLLAPERPCGYSFLTAADRQPALALAEKA